MTNINCNTTLVVLQLIIDNIEISYHSYSDVS
jgi:hypothetical protein